MEILTALVMMMIIIASIIGAIRLFSPLSQVISDKRGKASEVVVSRQLRLLDLKSYVVFENLILPSGGNTSHTEIDHVVVSPYGIFCIETKSHQGLIFGSKNREYWTQCIGNQKFRLYNPLRQNYKHTKAIEQLLGINVKAPVHSYVVFPRAHKLTIDSDNVTNNLAEVNRKISRHTQRVYNPHEYGRILKTLAFANSKSGELSDIHRHEVGAYLNSRLAQ